MRPLSISHVASVCSANSAIRTPPLNRLLIYWPRYLQVRGHGATRTVATGSSRARKALSTHAEFGVPLSYSENDNRYHDPKEYLEEYGDEVSGDTGEQRAAVLQAQPLANAAHIKADDRRYNDPKEYLEDDGDSLPEDTVERWKADLWAFPTEYAMSKYDPWLEKLGKSAPVTVARNPLLGDEQAQKTWVIGRRYQTDSWWKKAFLRLYVQFDTRLELELRGPEFLGDPRASQWAQPFLDTDLETQRSFWVNLDGRLAANIWPHVMLYVLHKHPEQALDMLNASILIPRQTSAVELVFSFAVMFAAQSEGNTRKHLLAKTLAFLNTSLRPDHVANYQAFAYSTMMLRQEQDPQQIPEFYKNLTERGFRMPCWSHVHFARVMALSGHMSQALDALNASLQAYEDPVFRSGNQEEDKISQTSEGSANTVQKKNFANSGAFRSVCSVILRRLMKEKDGYQAALQIVDRLLQVGFSTNTTLTNVLMHNAVEAGDAATCIGLYDAMAQNAISRDSASYSFALRALRDSTDGTKIQEVVNEAAAYRGEGEIFVRNAALRCLGSFYLRDSPRQAFPKLLNLYEQRFDVAPLVKLGIVRGSRIAATQNVAGASERLQPDKATIHTMLHSSFATREMGTTYILKTWQKFRELMHSDPLFAECGTSTYFYASFISRFGNRAENLAYCKTILDEMLSNATSASSEQSLASDLSTSRPPPPDTNVMNLMLQVYMHHKQYAAADEIRALMSKHDIPTNLVTYNTLVDGYAKEQDLERTARVLKELEHDGFEADDDTIRAIKAFEDQNALKDALHALVPKPGDFSTTYDPHGV